MRIRTLFLLTSLTSFVACGGDDDGDTDPTLGGTDPGSESGSATLTTTTPGTEDSGSEDTLTTTVDPDTGSDSGSADSGSDSSAGPADSSESGSESGGESVCEQYCAVYMTNCTNMEVSSQYADDAACLTACNAWDPGMPNDMAGNTQECHLYHAGAAAGDPGLHCPHSQEVPVGGCV